MKAISIYGIILFICFITFPPEQNINPSEIEAVKIDHRYLDEECNGINEYGYLVYKQAGSDLKTTSLVLAVIKAESDFKYDARSHKGAIGLMQLMPATAIEVGNKMGIRINKKDLKNPNINVKLGISYIKYLEKRLEYIEDEDRKLVLILASYNSGLQKVKRAFKCRGFKCYLDRANLSTNDQFNNALNGLPEETRRYLKNVQEHYSRYQKVFNSV